MTARRLRVLPLRANVGQRRPRLHDRRCCSGRSSCRLAAHGARLPDGPPGDARAAPPRGDRLRGVDPPAARLHARAPDPCPECSPLHAGQPLRGHRQGDGVGRSSSSLASVVAAGILAASATVLVRRWRAATQARAPGAGAGALHGPRAARRAHRAPRHPAVDARDRSSTRPAPPRAGLRRAAVGVPGRAAAQPLVARRRRRRPGRAPRRLERASLRDALADALGDPPLALVYWLAGAGALRRRHRRPSALPGRRRPARAATDGRARRRSASARSSTTAAVRGARLVARSPPRPRPRDARTSGWRPSCAPGSRSCSVSRARIIEAGLAERRRLERDLHDGAQQRLVALSLHAARSPQRKLARATRRGRARCSTGAREELDSRARGAARAGPRHPPGDADRPRPRRGARGARRARAGAGRARDVPRRAAADGRRGGRLLRRRRGADQRRQVRRRQHADRRASLRSNGYAVVEVDDDGVGGADPSAGPACAGLADRLGGPRRPARSRLSARVRARRSERGDPDARSR